MKFTDNKLEQLMSHNRGECRPDPGPSELRSDHPCRGCPYVRNRPCVTCLRAILFQKNGGNRHG